LFLLDGYQINFAPFVPDTISNCTKLADQNTRGVFHPAQGAALIDALQWLVADRAL
jgi:hypothetical protein